MNNHIQDEKGDEFMKEKQDKMLEKEKSSYKCYNIEFSNNKKRKHNRKSLRDSHREKKHENGIELLSTLTQGLLML